MSNINHPKHYNRGSIECIDIIAEVVKDSHGLEAFCIGNAIKYLYRAGQKGDKLEDYEKAMWYIGRVVEILKAENHQKFLEEFEKQPDNIEAWFGIDNEK